MDSLTQIVLGAAVGEVVMGKKLGNRAMVWGAISGTIPDLDIIAYAFMDEIDALAVHRGISHSFFFATLFPFLIGWLTHRLYLGEIYRKAWFRWIGISLGIVIFGAIGTVFNLIVSAIAGGVNYPVIVMTIALAILFFYRVYQRQKRSHVEKNIAYMDWVKLHFWAIFTHPLLDSCTTYGTQLFQPFWDYRVAFNNVSVVDPAYTVPFLIFLIIASLLPKGHKARTIVNALGLVVSSSYLVWTVSNKMKVNRIFEENLKSSSVRYERYMTTPTILNNVLWYGIAEGKDHYYRGFYSLLDSDEVIAIDSLEKGHHLIAPYDRERSIEILKWFSNGYYIVRPVEEDEEGMLQYYDVRFGAIGLENEEGEKEGEFVFGFDIDTSGNEVIVHEKRERPENAEETFKVFFKRIQGNESIR